MLDWRAPARRTESTAMTQRLPRLCVPRLKAPHVLLGVALAALGCGSGMSAPGNLDPSGTAATSGGSGAPGGTAGTGGTAGRGGTGGTGGTASTGGTGGTTPTCGGWRVELPPFPFDGDGVAVRGEDLLDALATDYVCGLAPGEPIDSDYFIMGYAPIAGFNRIIDEDLEDLQKLRWIFHLSGYFGGLWLHAALNPNQESGDPPDGWGLIDSVKLAKEAEAAIAGGPDTLLKYGKDTLFKFIFPSLGMASDFGYNKGYLLEIVERPPAGLTPPLGFVACNGLLWCEYVDQRVPALLALQATSQSLTNDDGRWKELREGSFLNVLDGVAKSESSGDSMGRLVWGTFMKKEGLTADSYARLLDVSASFLEVVQAAALFSAKGYAEQEMSSSRTGAYLQSGIAFWLASYMKAFPTGQGSTPDLPKLVGGTR